MESKTAGKDSASRHRLPFLVLVTIVGAVLIGVMWAVVPVILSLIGSALASG